MAEKKANKPAKPFGFTAKDICDIIESGGKHGAKILKYKDLYVNYDADALEESKQPTKDLKIQEVNSPVSDQEIVKQAEADIKEEQMLNLPLEDPEGFDEFLQKEANGELDARFNS